MARAARTSSEEFSALLFYSRAGDGSVSESRIWTNGFNDNKGDFSYVRFLTARTDKVCLGRWDLPWTLHLEIFKLRPIALHPRLYRHRLPAWSGSCRYLPILPSQPIVERWGRGGISTYSPLRNLVCTQLILKYNQLPGGKDNSTCARKHTLY